MDWLYWINQLNKPDELNELNKLNELKWMLNLKTIAGSLFFIRDHLRSGAQWWRVVRGSTKEELEDELSDRQINQSIASMFFSCPVKNWGFPIHVFCCLAVFILYEIFKNLFFTFAHDFFHFTFARVFWRRFSRIKFIWLSFACW